MNEQGVSSMPSPPFQYISLYTDEHIRLKRDPKPPPPVKDTYCMFGIPFQADDQIIQPLENQNLRRLYPQNYDHKRELKKLNHSILVNFLDLLEILIDCPDNPRRSEKIDDLTLLFIHMHHLINEFRPHQARETLRVMLQVQKRQRLETAQRFTEVLDKVNGLLAVAMTMLPNEAQLSLPIVVKEEPGLDVDDGDDEDKLMGDEENVEEITRQKDESMCGITDGIS